MINNKSEKARFLWNSQNSIYIDNPKNYKSNVPFCLNKSIIFNKTGTVELIIDSYDIKWFRFQEEFNISMVDRFVYSFTIEYPEHINRNFLREFSYYTENKIVIWMETNSYDRDYDINQEFTYNITLKINKL